MAELVMSRIARLITLPNGVTLDYVEQGDPDGVPVILLHGVTDSWWSWSRVLLELPAHLRVLAISQRGHGDSDKPDSGYRQADMATDVAQFLSAVDAPAAVVVGHSMGAGVALRFAVDHPDRVTDLVLVGAFADMSTNASVQDLWQTVATLTDPVDRDLAVDFQRSTLARPVPEGFFDWVVRESLKVPARVWRQAFAGFTEVNHIPELSRVSCPTLIVWGDQDDITTRVSQDALLAGLPLARLLVYEGGGHACHWESPARFAHDLVEACHRSGHR